MTLSASLLLGIDYGKARIGVAVGQTLTGNARPLSVVAAFNGVPDWQRLDQLIKQWRPDSIIVGNPMHADGSRSNMGKLVEAFVQELQQRHGLNVILHDERLTSQEAGQRFAEARRNKQAKAGAAKNLDAMAAALILESWLQDNSAAVT